MENLRVIDTPPAYSNYSFIAPKRQHKLTQSQKIIILEKLQTNLVLPDLLRNFSAIAAHYIRFKGLKFRHETNCIEIHKHPLDLFQQSFSLTNNNKDLGTLVYSSDEPLQINELSILKELHQLLVTNLMHALMFQEMQNRVLKDHLTGLDNRASFDENVQRSYSLCQRHKSNMVLLLTDLNNFKTINDTYGHQFGDKILCRYANVLQRCVRNSDMAFRLGGDEFAIILQPATDQSAKRVIERINHEIATDDLLREFKISSAIGSAMWRAGSTVDSLFKQADEALYQNKFNKE